MEVEAIKIPDFPETQKITPVSTSNSTISCPECKGLGRILYVPDKRELEYVYGDADVPVEFVKACPKCKGFRPTDEDRTETPDQYREAHIHKFQWDIYGVNMDKLKKIVFDFFENFKRWRDHSKGLYISSNTPGSGKTFLACCISKSVMMKYNIRYKFTTITDYLDKVSEGYTLSKQGITDSPADIYKEVELLVIDDIGAQLDKEWQNQEIFKLINERVNRGLITIYTSNFSVDKLKIDERIKSRIVGTSIPLQMPEVSIRQKKAVEGQNEFLKGIFAG